MTDDEKKEMSTKEEEERAKALEEELSEYTFDNERLKVSERDRILCDCSKAGRFYALIDVWNVWMLTDQYLNEHPNPGQGSLEFIETEATVNEVIDDLIHGLRPGGDNAAPLVRDKDLTILTEWAAAFEHGAKRLRTAAASAVSKKDVQRWWESHHPKGV